MVNSAFTTAFLFWFTGGFKVSKRMTPFTLTRIRDVWANCVTDVVEVYMSRQSLFETQSHITRICFSVLKKRWTDVTPSLTKASNMVSSSKSRGTPLITPWVPAREDGILQLTVLLPMFFLWREICQSYLILEGVSRGLPFSWSLRSCGILLLRSAPLIFLSSLSRILSPESLTLMNSGIEFGDWDMSESWAEMALLQHVSSKLCKWRDDAGPVGGDGRRERCRRWETGERGAKDGGDDGTCSESCDGGSWTEGG